MSAKRASSDHHESLFEAQWQPVSMLPAIGSMIDNWLDDVQVQYQTLEECRPTPHVLDDDTVGRVFEVYSVQRDDVALFEEQLRRWSGEGLSSAERAEVNRLSLQMLKVKDKIAAILTLAGELKGGTINRVLAKSDYELGQEFLRKCERVAAAAGPVPESGFSAEQLKTAAELDAKVLDILRAGGDDVRLLSRMHMDMPRFQWLMDSAGEGGTAELFERFDGLNHYAEVLEGFIAAVESGEFEGTQ
jgi:hypothetical protein